MSVLVCPVCAEKLAVSGNSYVCSARHCFDIARSGYVNLLLSKHVGKTVHGDNKLMVQARRDFLEKGYYSPLCEALCDEAEGRFAGGCVLDAGCGEGYYTAALSERLGTAEMYGFDISKIAAEMAAKRHKGITFAAASLFHIPAADCAFDMLVTLFAPYCGEEFLRVLKPGGVMIMAIPGELHLWEMKRKIYDIPYKNEVKPYELDGFEFVGKREIKYGIRLSSREDIASLFSMTPYYYRTGREQQERLAGLSELETTVHFELLTYIKPQ